MNNTLESLLRFVNLTTSGLLAGSLGMYGYDEGTRLARELEQLLDSGSSDAARIRGLIAELRAAVFPEQ